MSVRIFGLNIKQNRIAVELARYQGDVVTVAKKLELPLHYVTQQEMLISSKICSMHNTRNPDKAYWRLAKDLGISILVLICALLPLMDEDVNRTSRSRTSYSRVARRDSNGLVGWAEV